MKLITKKADYELIEIITIALLQDNRKLLKAINRHENLWNDGQKATRECEAIIIQRKKLYDPWKYFHHKSKNYESLLEIEINRINQSKKGKKKRIRTRIMEMLAENGKLYFITVTYTNKQLKKSNEKWRRKEISIILNKNKDYIANVDYGDDNGREHYHIITTQPIKWKKGYIKTKEINTTTEDIKRLTNYISKLTAHAVKESTRRGIKTPQIMYKRKPKQEKELPF